MSTQSCSKHSFDSASKVASITLREERADKYGSRGEFPFCEQMLKKYADARAAEVYSFFWERTAAAARCNLPDFCFRCRWCIRRSKGCSRGEKWRNAKGAPKSVNIGTSSWIGSVQTTLQNAEWEAHSVVYYEARQRSVERRGREMKEIWEATGEWLESDEMEKYWISDSKR